MPFDSGLGTGVKHGTRPRAAAKSSVSAQIERVRELLIKSIRLRLRADVPIGCYLSGGVDSCAVLGIASQHSVKPLTAFTISFEQELARGSLPTQVAVRTASSYGLPRDAGRDFGAAQTVGVIRLQ